MSPADYENAVDTRAFAVRNILVGHCGESLTPDRVDQIVQEIIHEMESSPTAWAFQPKAPKQEQRKPHSIFFFGYGVVAVCDQFGEQMPQYQDREPLALLALKRDGHDWRTFPEIHGRPSND